MVKSVRELKAFLMNNHQLLIRDAANFRSLTRQHFRIVTLSFQHNQLLIKALDEDHAWQPNLHKIQKDLMDMMSHLARPSEAKKENKNPMPVDGAEFCEQWIDELETAMTSPSDYFLLPGGNEVSALFTRKLR
jgi:hypothetical protein